MVATPALMSPTNCLAVTTPETLEFVTFIWVTEMLPNVPTPALMSPTNWRAVTTPLTLIPEALMSLIVLRPV